jgi:hypothetical protein
MRSRPTVSSSMCSFLMRARPMAYDAILAMAIESWCPGDRCE